MTNNTRPRMVRQNSPSSVAAFDDHSGQQTMQFPPSSSPQDMLQKVSNGQSSAVSISPSSSPLSCAVDTVAAAPNFAHDDERQRPFPNNSKGEQMFIHEGRSEDCGESSSSRPLSSCQSSAKSKAYANNTKLKRSVHFDEAVCINTIPSLEAYTDTEISSMYYSAEEEKILIRQKKAVVATLRASRTGTSSSMGGMMLTASPHRILDDDEEYCARGLENHLLSRECKRKKIAEALDVIYSVLMVQEDQYNNNYCDDAALAIASMTRSQAARTAAMERASRDEAEIKIAARNDFLDQTLAPGAKKADKFLATTRTGLVPNARRNSSNARSTCSARASCA